MEGRDPKGAGTDTGDEATDVMAFSSLVSAVDIGDLHRRIVRQLCDLGFSDYCFTTADHTHFDIGLTTFPQALVEQYRDNKFYEEDFLWRYISENDRPIYFSRLYSVAYDAPYSTVAFRNNQKIYELMQKFGYVDCYCVPLHVGDKRAVLVVSYRRSNEVGGEARSAIEFQGKVAHIKPILKVLCETIYALFSHKFQAPVAREENDSQPVEISRKQQLVLSTIANSDLTMAQVAEKLFLSPVTVNQHIAAARKALNVKTTVAAIKKAIKLGLINYT